MAEARSSTIYLPMATRVGATPRVAVVSYRQTER